MRVHGPEDQRIRVSLPTQHLKILVRIVARQTDEPPCLREAVPLDKIPIGPFDNERQEYLILILVVAQEEVQEKAWNVHETVPDRVGEIANFEPVGVPEVALVQQAAWMSDDGQRALRLEPFKELIQVPLPVRARDERTAKPNGQHAGAPPRQRTLPRASQRDLDATHHQQRAPGAVQAFRKNLGRVVIGRDEKVELGGAGGLEDLLDCAGAVMRQRGVGMNDAAELPVSFERRRRDPLAPQRLERIADRPDRRRRRAPADNRNESAQAGGEHSLDESTASPHGTRRYQIKRVWYNTRRHVNDAFSASQRAPRPAGGGFPATRNAALPFLADHATLPQRGEGRPGSAR